MPKSQSTEAKKARALQRAAGGKHTGNLRAAQIEADPFSRGTWGESATGGEHKEATATWHCQEAEFRAEEAMHDDGGAQPSDRTDFED